MNASNCNHWVLFLYRSEPKGSPNLFYRGASGLAITIIPVGISNIVLALQLGLLFESVSSLFFLCLFIAFCLFEIREFIEEYSWYYEEIPIEGMHDADEEDPF